MKNNASGRLYVFIGLQRDPSNSYTLGTIPSVLFSEVS